jgi:magnesium transporter
MIKFMLYQKNQGKVGGEELIQQWQETPGSWIWVDLFEEPAESEQDFLVDKFNLDKGAIAEAQRSRHPPSIELFDDYLYLLLKPLDAESDSLDYNTLQLAMFCSERFLVTRHSKDSPYLNKMWQKLETEGNTDESPMSVMTAMGKRVAQRYGKVLLDLEQRLDLIEDELFESPSDTLMKELVGYNTGLRKMRRILAYYVDVFSRLREHLIKSDSPHRVDVDVIFDLVERFHSLSGLYQEVITDLIEAYISLNGHRLNQIMKVLTIVTVVFVPLTLLVGIYGMNFEYMPELKSRYGYFILLSVMGGIAALLLYLFRRIRWV